MKREPLNLKKLQNDCCFHKYELMDVTIPHFLGDIRVYARASTGGSKKHSDEEQIFWPHMCTFEIQGGGVNSPTGYRSFSGMTLPPDLRNLEEIHKHILDIVSLDFKEEGELFSFSNTGEA